LDLLSLFERLHNVSIYSHFKLAFQMPNSPRGAALKPRKKPRQSRSVETVGVILEAAARILEQRDFAGYTTNAVAERAGVSIGSLYQYFPGKEALTAALIERETSLLLDDVMATDQTADGRQGLTLLIRAAVKHQMRRPVLARLLDFEEQRLPLSQQVRRISSILTDTIIRHMKRISGLGRSDMKEAAADIFAIVKGMVDAAGERGETASARLEERVARAVFGYLGLSSVATARRSTPATRPRSKP
jgi:AcrR family transcriptional regulator